MSEIKGILEQIQEKPTEPIPEKPTEQPSEKTVSNANKYFKLMAEFKAQLKTLSHNELARQYVALYAQHILLQKLHDDLKAATAADLEERSKQKTKGPKWLSKLLSR